jgi:curved DNA-binding protein CbpA
MQSVPDPYRVLGVRRDSTPAEVKAAHRRLAKRHHPDSPGGDRLRFLAIQAAYQLLSEPLQRRAWDARHAPGPIGAWEPGATTRGRGRRAAGPSSAGNVPPQREQPGRPAARSWRDTARAAWSADGVPWWEDGPRRSGTRRAGSAAGSSSPRDPGAHQPATGADPPAFDAAASQANASPRASAHAGEDGSPTAGRRRAGSDRRRHAYAGDSRAEPPTGEAGESAAASPRGRGGPRGQRPSGDAAAGSRGAGNRPFRRDASGAGARGDAAEGREPASPDRPTAPDMDAYARSSGAAWSAASRAYFRRMSAEIPRGARIRRGAEPRPTKRYAAHEGPPGPAAAPAGAAPSDASVREPDGASAAGSGDADPQWYRSPSPGDHQVRGSGPAAGTLVYRLHAALVRVRRTVGRGA